MKMLDYLVEATLRSGELGETLKLLNCFLHRAELEHYRTGAQIPIHQVVLNSCISVIIVQLRLSITKTSSFST